MIVDLFALCDMDGDIIIFNLCMATGLFANLQPYRLFAVQSEQYRCSSSNFLFFFCPFFFFFFFFLFFFFFFVVFFFFSVSLILKEIYRSLFKSSYSVGHFTRAIPYCWVDSGICECLYFQRIAETPKKLMILDIMLRFEPLAV